MPGTVKLVINNYNKRNLFQCPAVNLSSNHVIFKWRLQQDVSFTIMLVMLANYFFISLPRRCTVDGLFTSSPVSTKFI